MNISLVSSAINGIPSNRALLDELAKAVNVDEETISVMSGSGWGLNYAQFRTIDAINKHGYSGDAAMAMAFYAGKLNGIYETRRFFEPEEVVGFYEI